MGKLEGGQVTKQDLSCVNNFFSWPVDVWGFVTEFSLILCVFGMVHRIKVKGTEEYGLWREGGSLNLPVMGPIHLWFGFSGKTQMALPHRAVADTGRALAQAPGAGQVPSQCQVSVLIRGLDKFVPVTLSS